ncbi:MAG: hypothetical protein OXC00_02220 [Acidimicrobiaceae bacterium]|nr:hypothetical protein [Acidimicrobiaceae bacterium]
MSAATPSSRATAGSRGLGGEFDGEHSPSAPASDEVWPVYAGKSFNLWQPDTGEYYDSVHAMSITDHLQQKRLSQRRTRTSAFADLPEALLADPGSLPCRRARIAFRDVTNPTNTRTLVAALVPPDRVVVHKAPYLFQLAGSPSDEAYVLGVLCSMPCDWQARRTVELVMSFEQLRLLPVPDPGEGHPVRDRVVEIAGRLAAVDGRFADWALAVGVSVGSARDPSTKADLICDLDACVAHLYGLDEDDLAVLYGTFDAKRPDRYADHHAGVLTHFRRWSDTVHSLAP